MGRQYDDSIPPIPRTPTGQKDIGEYYFYVLKELKRHNEILERLQCTLTDIKVEIGVLKVKSHVWGLIGGAIPVLIALAIWILKTSTGSP